MSKLKVKLMKILLLMAVSGVSFYGQSEQTPKSAPKLVNQPENQKKTDEQSENKGEQTAKKAGEETVLTI